MIFGVIARPTLHKHAGQAVNIDPVLKNGKVTILDGGKKQLLDFYCFSSFFGDTKEEAETAFNLTEQLNSEVRAARQIVRETPPSLHNPPPVATATTNF